MRRRRRYWLGRLLFGLACLAAVGLLALVLLAPWLAGPETSAEGWQMLLRLYADDAVVRRVSVAAALGLLVTAFVFFLPARPPPGDFPRQPPPSDVAGA
jgi:hypothetical protein